MKKKLIIGCSCLAAILIIVLLVFSVFGGKLFSSQDKKDYYDNDKYTLSEESVDDVIAAKIDMEATEKTVIYQKDDMRLTLERAEYNAENDSIEFVIVSSGKVTENGVSYISLNDIESQLCTYYMGLIHIDLTDIQYLNKDGESSYLFTVTHDKNITADEFKIFSSTIYLDKVKCVTYTAK